MLRGIGKYGFLLASIYLLAFDPCFADADRDIHFNSGDTAGVMVELFTSQGCSSCPPAEQWLSELLDDERLWNKIIPIAFHVDYWDKLGWKDVFAQSAFSERQYRYFKQGAIRSVYTPGLLRNGQEWRDWHRGDHRLHVRPVASGMLSAQISANSIDASFDRPKIRLTLHIALLGVGIHSHIAKGENKGRSLTQDFVALKYMATTSDTPNWSVRLPNLDADVAERYGLVLWLSTDANQAPVQATAGWIPNQWVVPNDIASEDVE